MCLSAFINASNFPAAARSAWPVLRMKLAILSGESPSSIAIDPATWWLELTSGGCWDPDHNSNGSPWGVWFTPEPIDRSSRSCKTRNAPRNLSRKSPSVVCGWSHWAPADKVSRIPVGGSSAWSHRRLCITQHAQLHRFPRRFIIDIYIYSIYFIYTHWYWGNWKWFVQVN